MLMAQTDTFEPEKGKTDAMMKTGCQVVANGLLPWWEHCSVTQWYYQIHPLTNSTYQSKQSTPPTPLTSLQFHSLLKTTLAHPLSRWLLVPHPLILPANLYPPNTPSIQIYACISYVDFPADVLELCLHSSTIQQLVYAYEYFLEKSYPMRFTSPELKTALKGRFLRGCHEWRGRIGCEGLKAADGERVGMGDFVKWGEERVKACLLPSSPKGTGGGRRSRAGGGARAGESAIGGRALTEGERKVLLQLREIGASPVVGGTEDGAGTSHGRDKNKSVLGYLRNLFIPALEEKRNIWDIKYRIPQGDLGWVHAPYPEAGVTTSTNTNARNTNTTNNYQSMEQDKENLRLPPLQSACLKQKFPGLCNSLGVSTPLAPLQNSCTSNYPSSAIHGTLSPLQRSPIRPRPANISENSRGGKIRLHDNITKVPPWRAQEAASPRVTRSTTTPSIQALSSLAFDYTSHPLHHKVSSASELSKRKRSTCNLSQLRLERSSISTSVASPIHSKYQSVKAMASETSTRRDSTCSRLFPISPDTSAAQSACSSVEGSVSPIPAEPAAKRVRLITPPTEIEEGYGETPMDLDTPVPGIAELVRWAAGRDISPEPQAEAPLAPQQRPELPGPTNNISYTPLFWPPHPASTGQEITQFSVPTTGPSPKAKSETTYTQATGKTLSAYKDQKATSENVVERLSAISDAQKHMLRQEDGKLPPLPSPRLARVAMSPLSYKKHRIALMDRRRKEWEEREKREEAKRTVAAYIANKKAAEEGKEDKVRVQGNGETVIVVCRVAVSPQSRPQSPAHSEQQHRTSSPSNALLISHNEGDPPKTVAAPPANNTSSPITAIFFDKDRQLSMVRIKGSTPNTAEMISCTVRSMKVDNKTGDEDCHWDNIEPGWYEPLTASSSPPNIFNPKSKKGETVITGTVEDGPGWLKRRVSVSLLPNNYNKRASTTSYLSLSSSPIPLPSSSSPIQNMIRTSRLREWVAQDDGAGYIYSTTPTPSDSAPSATGNAFGWGGPLIDLTNLTTSSDEDDNEYSDDEDHDDWELTPRPHHYGRRSKMVINTITINDSFSNEIIASWPSTSPYSITSPSENSVKIFPKPRIGVSENGGGVDVQTMCIRYPKRKGMRLWVNGEEWVKCHQDTYRDMDGQGWATVEVEKGGRVREIEE